MNSYAGWIGTVAATSVESSGRVGDMPVLAESFSRLAAVAGTSTCHIVQSPRKIAVPGVVSVIQLRRLTSTVGSISGRCFPRDMDERRWTIVDRSTHRFHDDYSSGVSRAHGTGH